MANKVEVKVGDKVYLMNQVTYSKSERTIFDWDSSYIEEFMRSGDVEMELNEPTDSSDVRMRVNEFGQIVQPPLPPEKPDRSKWKRMTPKRVEILAEYKMAKAEYDKELEAWLKLPFLDEGRTREEHIHGLIMTLRNKPLFHGITHRRYYDYLNGVFDPQPAVLVYWARGFGEVRICSRPVTHTELKVVGCDVNNNYWAQIGFEGNASHKRRHYKRNRSIPKEDWADTDLETGEQLQRTLFDFTEVKGYNPNPRVVVNYDLFESFETKPNSYLSKAYLEYLINGTPLTDWQKFQLNKRMTKTVNVKEGQQTLL